MVLPDVLGTVSMALGVTVLVIAWQVRRRAPNAPVAIWRIQAGWGSYLIMSGVVIAFVLPSTVVEHQPSRRSTAPTTTPTRPPAPPAARISDEPGTTSPFMQGVDPDGRVPVVQMTLRKVAGAIDACAAGTDGDYSACADVVPAGVVVGINEGEASVTVTRSSYTVRVLAGEGTRWTLSRGPEGKVTRTCAPRGASTCPADGRW